MDIEGLPKQKKAAPKNRQVWSVAWPCVWATAWGGNAVRVGFGTQRKMRSRTHAHPLHWRYEFSTKVCLPSQLLSFKSVIVKKIKTSPIKSRDIPMDALIATLRVPLNNLNERRVKVQCHARHQSAELPTRFCAQSDKGSRRCSNIHWLERHSLRESCNKVRSCPIDLGHLHSVRNRRMSQKG
eukprot:6460043-Amphidinium_carterae.1